MSAESPHPAPDPAHGETFDPKTGAKIARLPVRTRPCWATADSLGNHTDCHYCSGTGAIAIREPREGAVDAADDGLEALIDALAERDENGNRVNDYLGASVESLMAQPADGNKRTGGGSKSGGSKSKPKRRRFGDEIPSKKWMDGARELTGRPPNKREVDHEKAREADMLAREAAGEKHVRRAGRKSRFGGQTRNERISTSIDPGTRAGLRILNTDLAALVDGIMQEPESLAVVMQAKAAVAKTTYEATLRDAAVRELRMRSGEEQVDRISVSRIRARIKRAYLDMVEAEALCASG